MKKKAVWILMTIGLCLSAQAASDSWKLDAAGNWTNAASWTGGNIPGVSGGTASADVATFAATLTTNRLITVDANRNIGGVTFGNPANVPGVNAATTVGYTLTNGSLRLSSGGVIQVSNASGTNMSTVASSVTIQGDGGSATFRNDAAGGKSGLLINGTVAGASTAGNATTLYLDGVSTSVGTGGNGRNNGVNGIISDGVAGGKVKVVKNGTGLWTLGGANTFTGGLELNAGTIRYSAVKNFGSGDVTIGGDVSLYHANSTALTMTNAMSVKGNITFNGSDNAGFSGAMDFNSSIRTLTTSGLTNILISGKISNGGLIKSGAGTLFLAASNDISSVTVSAGTLTGDANGCFGSGSLTVGLAGTNTVGTLTLNGAYMNDLATLILNTNSILNLNFTGADTVSGITIDGTALSAGTYNATALDALGVGTVTGTGSLTVIPEPTTISLFVVSGVGVLLIRRMRIR